MAPFPIPALFPPGDGAHHEWPAPNYVNPETRDWTASACIIALFVVTLAVFSTRIYARARITRTFGLDDWLIIASMPALLGLMISTVLGLRIYGFQLHIYDQTPHTRITVRQITLSIEIIYLATTTLTKISILTFYRRLTSSLISRSLFIVIWASIVFVAAYGITFIFVLLFTCSPVEAYWYRFTTSWLKTHKYKCHDELTTLVVIISISTAQDLIACILPMFIISKVRLPRLQKIGLVGVFALGLATCGIGALRVHYAHKVYHYVKANDPTYDISWQALGAWVSTAVEANVAVICASAPALRIYFRCFDSPQETRSFNWYYGSGSHSSQASWISRASKKAFAVCCRPRRPRINEVEVSEGSRVDGKTSSRPRSGSVLGSPTLKCNREMIELPDVPKDTRTEVRKDSTIPYLD